MPEQQTLRQQQQTQTQLHRQQRVAQNVLGQQVSQRRAAGGSIFDQPAREAELSQYIKDIGTARGFGTTVGGLNQQRQAREDRTFQTGARDRRLGVELGQGRANITKTLGEADLARGQATEARESAPTAIRKAEIESGTRKHEADQKRIAQVRSSLIGAGAQRGVATTQAGAEGRRSEAMENVASTYSKSRERIATLQAALGGLSGQQRVAAQGQIEAMKEASGIIEGISGMLKNEELTDDVRARLEASAINISDILTASMLGPAEPQAAAPRQEAPALAPSPTLAERGGLVSVVPQKVGETFSGIQRTLFGKPEVTREEARGMKFDTRLFD